jgi:hypothetical protein
MHDNYRDKNNAVTAAELTIRQQYSTSQIMIAIQYPELLAIMMVVKLRIMIDLERPQLDKLVYICLYMFVYIYITTIVRRKIAGYIYN